MSRNMSRDMPRCKARDDKSQPFSIDHFVRSSGEAIWFPREKGRAAPSSPLFLSVACSILCILFQRTTKSSRYDSTRSNVECSGKVQQREVRGTWHLLFAMSLPLPERSEARIHASTRLTSDPLFKPNHFEKRHFEMNAFGN